MKRAPLVAVALATSLALHAAAAHADDAAGRVRPPGKAACLDSASTGQTLRDAHKLVLARVQFQICASATCPAGVQRDCVTWLAELDRTVPTLVLSAKDGAGKDLVDIRVSMDGQPLVSTLDGRAVAVDPGMHTFRFERADGTQVTEPTLVKEGEKAQPLAVVLRGREAAAASRSSAWSALRIASVVVASLGVVGVATGIGLEVDAKSNDDTARAETGPQRNADSESAVNEGTAASVVLGVSAAVAAAGIVMWFVAPTAHVSVGTSGREVTVGGTF
jgi:hypothetical protein